MSAEIMNHPKSITSVDVVLLSIFPFNQRYIIIKPLADSEALGH